MLFVSEKAMEAYFVIFQLEKKKSIQILNLK